jgi:hypothetical protein
MGVYVIGKVQTLRYKKSGKEASRDFLYTNLGILSSSDGV